MAKFEVNNLLGGNSITQKYDAGKLNQSLRCLRCCQKVIRCFQKLGKKPTRVYMYIVKQGKK